MVTIDTALTLPSTSSNLADPDVWGQQLNTAMGKLKVAIEALNAGKSEPGATLTELVQDAVAAMLVAGSGVGVLYNDTAGTLTLTNTSSGGSTDAEVVRDTIGAALAAGANITLTVDDANDKITIAAANSTDPEVVRDVVGATLRAGTGISVTVDDAGDTITLAATGGSTGGGVSQADVGGYWSVRRRPYLITGLTAGADNTSKINAAISSAQKYDTVKIPPGVWTHSSQLVVPAAATDLTIDGYGAELVATVPATAALRVQADRTALHGVRHRVDWGSATPTRGTGQNYDDSPITAFTVADLTLIDCVSTGSRDGGIFLFQVTGALLRNVEARDSMADGLHMTYGTTRVVADGVHALNNGDDGVAVVSYGGDPVTCSNIRVHKIGVVNNNARGLSIVGGTDVHYSDFKVTRSRGSGIYIAQENGATADATTQPVTNASVVDGTVIDANWGTDLDTGSLGLFAQTSGQVVSDILVAGITVHGNRKFSTGEPYAKIGTNGGNGGRFRRAKLQDIHFLGGTARTGVYVDGTSSELVDFGSYKYIRMAGTGVTQNTEGAILAGATSSSASDTTATSPGVTLQRVRTGGLYAAGAN